MLINSRSLQTSSLISVQRHACRSLTSVPDRKFQATVVKLMKFKTLNALGDDNKEVSRDSNAGSAEEQPATASPPHPTKVSSSATTVPSPTPTASEPSSSSASSYSQSNGEEDVDEQLKKTWTDLKQNAGKVLNPEDAKILESITYEEVSKGGEKMMRKVVGQQLGPILELAGVTEDPYAFFVDMLKVGAFIQLITCGTLFYSTELIGHFDTGEAFRAVVGLTLGYVLRPFFRVEQLLWPIYNWGVKLISPQTEYQIPASSQTDVQNTLNQLGILVALVFFLPQATLHWDAAEVSQLVAPMALGLFMFDVVYMFALLLKLRLL
ncbi:hypothetical protein CEUSTIGMA_g7929.t1 [Chlamydomonas eustigma]|uniref:Uncharacterized protein n=1 Tax=Chlamydomonas eustigma TaxID=1157962 RepID=A0A250XBM8_9CHLO|nr:hypothetical protein CEUSTIGMA_g7929.t1 [Chlamydomonas eustigma]|eukprot:GAX80491.1 hypothetical protein CEUSTIGMA_g7929.t1 [Chlamydomonas eustigma]